MRLVVTRINSKDESSEERLLLNKLSSSLSSRKCLVMENMTATISKPQRVSSCLLWSSNEHAPEKLLLLELVRALTDYADQVNLN